MILHIPHSSLHVPDDCEHRYSIPDHERYTHTDLYTDELFPYIGERLVFPYSRFYCDVERLHNDPLEEKGRGIIYTHLSDGTPFREVDQEEHSRIMVLYNEHHNKLRGEAIKQSTMLDNVVVVDCHSFSAEQVLHEESILPDICIGYNNDGTRLPDEVIRGLATVFINSGYSVAYNFPYGNSIFVPEKENIYSVMIEVNKRTYLTPNYEKSRGFEKMKAVITTALDFLSDFELGD